MTNKIKDSLSTKVDTALLDEVKTLVCREKEIIVEVIEYLKEIEFRKLHLARGYPSMFAFCTDFLGYSEAEAHIRIQAARLIQALPEVTNLIESGAMSLSVAATTQSHFRRENQRRKDLGQANLSVQEKREVLNLVSGQSRREAEQSLNTHFAQSSMKTLNFEANPALLQRIEKLMDLMAHKNFDRDLGTMIEILVEQELAKYEKKLGSPKNEKLNTRFPTKETRYLPQKTKSLVWANHQGRCTYKDPATGRICGSKHGIQVDHQTPFSQGGTGEIQNLTLLCASHNQWKRNRRVPPSNPLPKQITSGNCVSTITPNGGVNWD